MYTKLESLVVDSAAKVVKVTGVAGVIGLLLTIVSGSETIGIISGIAMLIWTIAFSIGVFGDEGSLDKLFETDTNSWVGNILTFIYWFISFMGWIFMLGTSIITIVVSAITGVNDATVMEPVQIVSIIAICIWGINGVLWLSTDKFIGMIERLDRYE